MSMKRTIARFAQGLVVGAVFGSVAVVVTHVIVRARG